MTVGDACFDLNAELDHLSVSDLDYGEKLDKAVNTFAESVAFYEVHGLTLSDAALALRLRCAAVFSSFCGYHRASEITPEAVDKLRTLADSVRACEDCDGAWKNDGTWADNGDDVIAKSAAKRKSLVDATFDELGRDILAAIRMTQVPYIRVTEEV